MDDQQPKTVTLAELKRKIDEEIRPLIPHLRSPLDRCNAYLSLLRDNWSDELAQQAFKEAQQIESPEDKFYSLQSLSNDIYFHERDIAGTQPPQA